MRWYWMTCIVAISTPQSRWFPTKKNTASYMGHRRTAQQAGRKTLQGADGPGQPVSLSCVIISTHLIADVEKVLDEVVFIDRGQIFFQSSVDQIREEKGKSVDALFREVYRC